MSFLSRKKVLEEQKEYININTTPKTKAFPLWRSNRHSSHQLPCTTPCAVGDGQLALAQRVEELGLAHVGLAHQDHLGAWVVSVRVCVVLSTLKKKKRFLVPGIDFTV